jgi:hypothetical protein
VPVTARLPVDGLLKRGADIAAASARGQLEQRGRTTAARGVDLVKQAAEGAGVATLLGGLSRLLPTTVKTLVAVGIGALLLLAIVFAGLGWWWAAAFVLGLLVGCTALTAAVVWFAGNRLRQTIREALTRITERPELGARAEEPKR